MKIRKYIAVCCLFTLFVGLGWSQSVTINNSSTSILLIDPLKNTSGTSGTSDDVVILSNGNVGIGTPAPSVRLDIRGTLRIVDGAQGEGAFLVSDAAGVGSWYDSNFIGRRVVWGSIVQTKNLSATYQDITSVPLDLTGGLWMIVAKTDVVGTISNTALATAEYVWLKIVEEVTDNTSGAKTYSDVSEGGVPYSIRKGVYQKYYSTPMVQGFISIPVEGINQKKRKYSVQIKNPSTDYTNAQLTGDLTGAYFYAIKLQ
ncbi:hypothetical protein CLV62_101299 [Dysgonomonas alginatilytica]|uniref:Uncharacterized protein n=1 Tax=Dysgonomonas alginatilytica TaxID=1605892 RepID=A0A2V3PTK8_9BACT|nr:hypothetical protein [Dysgonomonas alginatilytica]PXV69030.1 hypothetical protein CLV62_101299 [Dysgonomonas alginatilytica]